MKRTIALAAAACTLAVPALAFGQTFVGLFTGHLEGLPDSAVVLKFSGAHNPDGSDQTQVSKFVVRDFDVTCSDDVVATLGHAKLKGKVLVGDGGNFRVSDDNRKTVFKVSGHIGVNKAFGSFRLSGKITGTDDVVRDCDSGAVGWVARPPSS